MHAQTEKSGKNVIINARRAGDGTKQENCAEQPKESTVRPPNP